MGQFIFCSPFAPLEERPLAAMATEEDEQALKEVEGMTLIGQTVHPDCRPVLEFGIVSHYDAICSEGLRNYEFQEGGRDTDFPVKGL